MRTFLLLLLLPASASVVEAASLVAFQVMPDGSAKPPGDSIQVSLLFAPNETADVDIQIRAYVRPDSDLPELADKEPLPVDSAVGNGPFLIRAKLAVADSPIVQQQFVAEFSRMNVPLGKHLLAYELQVIRQDTVQFSATSPWTGLEITQDARMVYQPRHISRQVAVTNFQEVMVPDSDAPDGFINELMPYTEMKQVFQTQNTQDNPEAVPGGFHRGFGDYRAFSTEEPADRELSGATPNQWVPLPKVRIQYATNRNIVDSQSNTPDRYGNRLSASLSYGTLLVNIPVSLHVPGQLELKKWYQRQDPEKHFFVDRLVGMDLRTFFNLMKNQIASNDILVMIHGYQNSMQFAAMRAAQVKHDIQFPGSVVLFCWPSQGTLQGYRQDERLSAASVDQFVEFMNLLLSSQSTSSNPGRIHLLAHSMGNRILLEGLASLQSGNRIPQNAIGHIVMAAPDVDHSQFLLNFPKVAQSAGSVTMYFCRDDKALLASQAVHVDSRIGQKLVPYDPLINIDAAQANTSFLGHDYFAARNPLLVDLQMHLVMGYGPDRRPTIRPATISGFQYWKFP